MDKVKQYIENINKKYGSKIEFVEFKSDTGQFPGHDICTDYYIGINRDNDAFKNYDHETFCLLRDKYLCIGNDHNSAHTEDFILKQAKKWVEENKNTLLNT